MVRALFFVRAREPHPAALARTAGGFPILLLSRQPVVPVSATGARGCGAGRETRACGARDRGHVRFRSWADGLRCDCKASWSRARTGPCTGLCTDLCTISCTNRAAEAESATPRLDFPIKSRVIWDFGSGGRGGCLPTNTFEIKGKFPPSLDRIQRCAIKSAVLRARSQQVHMAVG